MKKLLTVAGITAALFSGGALADPNPSNAPLEQAIESVTNNSAAHPENAGLRNARNHLFENLVRQETRGHGNASAPQRIERVERPERPERIERVDFTAVSEITRGNRPDRPQRNGRR